MDDTFLVRLVAVSVEVVLERDAERGEFGVGVSRGAPVALAASFKGEGRTPGVLGETAAPGSVD